MNMQMQQMMKQAQQLQQKMQKIQKKIGEAEFTGKAGGGLVEFTVTGKGEPRGCKIDPSLLNPEEGEVLEDLIVAALANAKSEADDALTQAMQEAGISPELMNFGEGGVKSGY